MHIQNPVINILPALQSILPGAMYAASLLASLTLH